MELYNNKDNEYIKFKINSEGVDIKNIEPRLLLTTENNKNYFILGKVENGVCKFRVPELTLYEKGEKGRIKFEIISENSYFPVWQDQFEIKTKTSLTVEQLIDEIQHKPVEPKISVSNILNEEVVVEDEEVELPKLNEQKKDIEEMFKLTKESKEEKVEEKEEVEEKVVKKETGIKIKKFDIFN